MTDDARTESYELITDSEIRSDERVQRAEDAVRQWCEEHDGDPFDALFGDEGRKLHARLGGVRVKVAAERRRALLREPIVAIPQVTHGVECYEAWRDDHSCPHESEVR